ncbi:MAG: tRNA epoxyqueuosine(34) reductase QueG [Gemmatimonadales bacterium]|nr:MAG: tRNA epoxyqueuosine(34) reductase QueG [Gemmatimonadales bacterium]
MSAAGRDRTGGPETGGEAGTAGIPDPAVLRRLLLRHAREAGFDLAGVAAAHPSEHGAFLDAWLAASHHGTMQYLARPDAVARRKDPALTLPGARSALVVGHGHFQEDPPGVPNDASRGVIARYARGRDYHKVVTRGLKEVARGMEAACREAGEAPPEWRICVDTAPVLERELARRAGLGWFGRNTMLIHPRRGSHFFLGVLLLDAEVEADAPFERDHCGSCRACLDACPTGALLGRNEKGAPVMDARRCISYLTIEHRGPIPVEFREAMGNRVYGCDICQEVCPFSRSFSSTASEASYAARGPGEVPVGVEAVAGEFGPTSAPAAHPGTDAPSLVQLLEMALDPERWEAFSRGSAIRRAGRAGFARNVCVSLGNWLASATEPPAEALSALSAALSDPEPLVRGHAAWALGRAGGAGVGELLSTAAGSESDSWVLEEVESAQSMASGRSFGEFGDGDR